MYLTNFFSHLFGKIAEQTTPEILSRCILDTFVRIYKPNLDECARPLGSFASLAEFFVRELKPEARPIAKAPVAPVDGVLRTFGDIREGKLEQIKGRDYSLEGLVQSSALANQFQHGYYLNFYLSPKDCHHVFSPVAGNVTEIKYIPGALFPVNNFAIRNIPGLFLKNERLVTRIAGGGGSEFGDVLVVMVGAFNVGKLYSAFGEVGLGQGGLSTDIAADSSSVAAGQRIGTFGLGSSVVLIFERALMQNALALREGQCVRYGQPLLPGWGQVVVVPSKGS